MSRIICLDTETTGLEVSQGHRIIEIGAVELIEREITGRQFHKYINPMRLVDKGAFDVHGISNDFLHDKPLFKDVCDDFLNFIDGAELVIHNAPFDLGFLNHECERLNYGPQRIESRCTITDTLKLAKAKHRGQKNNLDALCKRYGIDNSNRTLHGALLDSEILADVYLAMTGGQINLFTQSGESSTTSNLNEAAKTVQGGTQIVDHGEYKVIYANAEELAAHEKFMTQILKEEA
jgi:DNA polymerase-3 subunit epsilon